MTTRMIYTVEPQEIGYKITVTIQSKITDFEVIIWERHVDDSVVANEIWQFIEKFAEHTDLDNKYQIMQFASSCIDFMEKFWEFWRNSPYDPNDVK